MKKNDLLKLALIIAFTAFVLDNIGMDTYRGLIDGWRSNERHARRHVDVLIEARLWIKNADNGIMVDSLRKLENIKVDAKLSIADVETPWYLDGINSILLIAFAYLNIGLVRRAYKIITAISNNNAFDYAVINNLNYAGYYFLLLFIITDVLERLFIIQNKIWVGAKLQLINKTEFHLEFLVAGLFVLLIARAFEQGMKLNEEQKLTI
jgi:hypothetical protein